MCWDTTESRGSLTFEAEAVGAILALWLVRNTQEAIGKRVSLYVDNQAVIKALSSTKALSGQHLITAIRQAANATQATCQ